MTDRPTPKIPLTPSEIPEELRSLQRWVVWRYERKSGNWTKVPVVADDRLVRASSTNPESWRGFDEALACVDRHESLAGLGFVFTSEDGYIGVDLDECCDAEGVINKDAQRLIDDLGSYAERSPSGTGVKLILHGRKPPGARCKVRGIHGCSAVEVYDHARFFCLTGAALPDKEAITEPQPEVLRAFFEPFLPPPAPPSGPPSTPTPPTPNNGSHRLNGDGAAFTDEELLRKARNAANGAMFGALYDRGDLSKYNGDESAADVALCNVLAFWTDRDAAVMDRLFRGSALMRPKWDEQRGGTTYGAMTIARAIEGCGEGYTPGGGHRAAGAFNLTDLGNAERFAAMFSGRVRYCHEMASWLEWDGQRWKRGNEAAAVRLAGEMARASTGRPMGRPTLRGRICSATGPSSANPRAVCPRPWNWHGTRRASRSARSSSTHTLIS